MAIQITGTFEPTGDFPLAKAKDIEMPDGTKLSDFKGGVASVNGQTGDVNITVKDGEDGEPGKDGVTPHIGTNGNWWIGETDTGVKAEGETGPQGPQGETGPAGANGKDGQDGAPGAKGDKGDKGDPGEQGIQGIQGIPGEKGEKGDKGDTGAQGAKGEKGEKGDQGPIGLAVQTSGYVVFDITDEGILRCTYFGDEPPNYSINDDGHLILEI